MYTQCYASESTCKYNTFTVMKCVGILPLHVYNVHLHSLQEQCADHTLVPRHIQNPLFPLTLGPCIIYI